MESDLCGLSATSLFTGSLRRRGSSSQAVRHAELVCMANQSPQALKFISVVEQLRHSYRLGLASETIQGLKEMTNILAQRASATMRILSRVDTFDLIRQIAASSASPPEMRKMALAVVLNIIVGSDDEMTKAVNSSFLDVVVDDFVLNCADQELLKIAVVLCDSLFQRSSQLAHEFVQSGRFDRYVDAFKAAGDREVIETMGFLVPTFLDSNFPIHFKRRLALLECLVKLSQHTCDLLFLEGLSRFSVNDNVELRQRFFRDFDFESRVVQMLGVRNEKVVSMALSVLKFMHKQNGTTIPVKRVLDLACCVDCGPVSSAALRLLCVFVKVRKTAAVSSLMSKRFYEFLTAQYDSLAFDVKGQATCLFAFTAINCEPAQLGQLDKLQVFDVVFGNLSYDEPRLLRVLIKLVLSLAKSEVGISVLTRNAARLFQFLDQIDDMNPSRSSFTILSKYLHNVLSIAVTP